MIGKPTSRWCRTGGNAIGAEVKSAIGADVNCNDDSAGRNNNVANKCAAAGSEFLAAAVPHRECDLHQQIAHARQLRNHNEA